METARQFTEAYKKRPRFHVGLVEVARVLPTGKLYISQEFLKSPGFSQENAIRFARWLSTTYLSNETSQIGSIFETTNNKE